jgi:hypothetical protein
MLLRRQAEKRDTATELLELWAGVADLLSYYQDQIANEAYLESARDGTLTRACRSRHRKLALRLLVLATSLAAVAVYVALGRATGRTR